MLRTQAEPVVDFDLELRNLVKDLQETMLDAPGVGLAAPQIGVSLRVFAYQLAEPPGPQLRAEGLAVPPREEAQQEGFHRRSRVDACMFNGRLMPPHRCAVQHGKG